MCHLLLLPVVHPVHIRRVEASASADSRMFLQHVAEHKVNYKHLVGVEFFSVIPKNPSGKLLRRFLRDKACRAT